MRIILLIVLSFYFLNVYSQDTKKTEIILQITQLNQSQNHISIKSS